MEHHLWPARDRPARLFVCHAHASVLDFQAWRDRQREENGRYARAVLLAAIAGVCAVLSVHAQEESDPYPRPEQRYEVRLEKHVMVPMRDGVRLSTDLYFPVGAAEPLPVIQIRTPYDKRPHRGEGSAARFFAGQGYAVAVQDMRGRFHSEGEYVVSAADREDGTDLVTWLAERPWSNGKVGSYGCSYLGENQMQLAAMRNPAHAAALPQAAGGAYRYFGVVYGGAIELAASLGWFRGAGTKLFYRPPPGTPDSVVRAHDELFRMIPELPEIDFHDVWRTLPLVEMLDRAGAPPTDFEAFVSHEPADRWWNALGYVQPTDSFDVPALHVNSWYDLGVAETLEMFVLLRENATSERGRENQYAIISPTDHCSSERATANTVVGRRPLGDARLPYWDLYLAWFDRWLKGNEDALEGWPKLRYYLMGKNEWREAEAWPVPGTRLVDYYLRSGGSANSRFGDGTLSTTPPDEEPPDRYTYDPASPVPTVGGPVCCTGTPDAPAGGFDQREVEMREDVLVYTSEPLANGLEVTGPVELVLHVSSDVPDTDFVAKLVDVHPDGTAYNVTEGIQRARYREGYEHKVWMEEGEVYEVRVDLAATANWFGPGHRIRLEVTSSSFPRWDRNLNTGGANYDETEWRVAENAVHHSGAHPSRLVLPVVPR